MAGGLGFIGKLPDRRFKGSMVDHDWNKSIKNIVLTSVFHTLRKNLSIKKGIYSYVFFFCFFFLLQRYPCEYVDIPFGPYVHG